MHRRLSLLSLLLLSGCTEFSGSAFCPSEARAALSQGMDDDGRNPRTTATVEVRWPLRPWPAPTPTYLVLPATERPARTHFFAEPPCSNQP